MNRRKKLSAKTAFGHRSHVSGKNSVRYGARLKDKLVKRTKQLEAELKAKASNVAG